MAEVADLLLPLEEDDDEQEEYQETLDPSPFWSSSDFDPNPHPDLFVPLFSSHLSLSDPVDPDDPNRNFESGSESDSDYLEDQVSLTLDLFDRCPPQPHPFSETLDPLEFRVFDSVEDMGSDYMGLGLGLGFERQEDGEDVNFEVGSDWGGDGFFVGRRSVESEPGGSPVDGGEGIRIDGFGSDSDSCGSNSDIGDPPDRIGDDLGLPLCWDCLHIEEDRRDPNEEFEWEEVDGRIDERDVFSMMVDADEARFNGIEDAEHGVVEVEEIVVRNIEWEVLLSVNNLGRNPDAETYLGDDHDDYVYTSEYEVLFGQFPDHDSSIRGSPPASKLVVENLPSVVLTKEDVANNNTLCAVCKDEISFEERAKRLPCSHHYHGECILPWLGIRNTCPVCRYELPTDDAEYENWKAQRAGNRGSEDGSQVRYDFEMFPAD